MYVMNILTYRSEFKKAWSGLRGSNPRPHGPKPCALPNCAKPRYIRKTTPNYYIRIDVICQNFKMEIIGKYILNSASFFENRNFSYQCKNYVLVFFVDT